MSTRYSKKHVRRQAVATHDQWVAVDDSGLVVTCDPPHWRCPRDFDFAFLTPFALTTLASEIAVAFGRFAIRFARDTAVSRYTAFKNLWLAIAGQTESPPGTPNLRTGELASWWKGAAQAYAAAEYERAIKGTSAKVTLQNAWTVLDEMASCGFLPDVPPKEPPKNLHLTKVPRPSLVEQTASRPPTEEEKSALVRHFRSIGVPVEDAEAEAFVELLAGLLTPEERQDPKKATNAFFVRTTEYLRALIAAAEGSFLKWQQHYVEGQRLLELADREVLNAFPEGKLPKERGSLHFHRFFPKSDMRQATANFLLLMRENYQGCVPSAETMQKPWSSRYTKLVMRLGGRYHLDAMLSLHREAIAAAAFLYIADTGANLSTALSLETEFERATSDTNLVEFYAVKARARYAAIYDVLPVNDAGRHISTVKALRAVVEMTSERRTQFPELGRSLFVFSYFHEPSIAIGGFLSKQLEYLLRSAGLPQQWTLSGVRAAVGIADTLDGTGTLNGLRRKLSHGTSSFATTVGYGLRWPVRKQLELEMAKYQRLFQAGVASNLQGALQWLHKTPEEAASLLEEAERTGLGFLCAAPRSGARPGTQAGTPCGKVGQCAQCEVRLFVTDEESLAEVIATNSSLNANLARLETESAERLDDLWIELLAFTTVAIEEAKRGSFAYLVPRAMRKAEQWLAAGFDITDLRP